MNIHIYVVGEKIDKFYLEGIREYEKRLSRYCKVKLQHFKKEDALLKKLSNKSYKIKVSTEGHMLSSEELALKIDNMGITGNSDVTILIGAKNAPHDEDISISKMDMDLGSSTLVIFEQLYRAYRILKNEPYHK